MPLQKNQIIELCVTGVAADGSGVGRFCDAGDTGAGMAVFVPHTAPGDVALCRVVKVEKRLAYARVEKLLTPSPDRIAVDCPVFGRCGGCAWRHVSYAAELRYKEQQVADVLARIGGLDVRPEPIVGCAEPDGWRGKAQVPVAMGEDGRLKMGYYAPRSHRLVEATGCRLHPEGFEALLRAIADWAAGGGVTAYDETTGKGLLRHVYLRRGHTTGDVMVCLVCTSGKLPRTDELVAGLRAADAGVRSVVVNLNKKDTNVILGSESFTLWGDGFITDELCGLRVRLSPEAFYQINAAQAERLYALAADAAGLTGGETVLDLYCGAGLIGLSMAHRAREVIGVETVAQAVENARRNAADNGITNARFLHADAAEAAAGLARERVRPDVVILDPPRKGCAPELPETVAAMRPRRVVYVSCDPATLARDLKRFAALGYRTDRVTPVDMFPRTGHVECVAMLTRDDT